MLLKKEMSRRSTLAGLKITALLATTSALWKPSLALAADPAPATVATDSNPVGEWRHYGADLASTKYSPLDKINRDNVKNLRIAWRWKSDNFGARPEFNLEATPLMVNGTLYTTVGTRRDLVAINAATGETLWMYRNDEGPRGQVAPRLNHRGCAYWTDGNGSERIFYVTAGYHLISLDAKTGYPISNFGESGVVDLYKDFDQPEPKDGLIGSSSPPLVIGDIVVVGAALQATSPTRENTKAFVRGYNIRTGKREWIFHTVPLPGEFGYDTWKKGSADYTGNTAVWTTMSADPELGYVYLPVETPTNDFYGGDRPGDGLFGETLVCVDAKTGKRIWHFQLVHHGIWDYDTVAPPILLDVKVNGKKIKAVAQITKQAFMYVFDRVTGKPVWPIVERPVPKSDVPNEETSPTQPIPTKPAPYDLQDITVDNLIDFTPKLREEAKQFVEGYKLGGVFSPPMLPHEGFKGLLKLPAATGGANWQGGAADPETGIVYVASTTNVAGTTAPGITGAPPLPRPADPYADQPGIHNFGPEGLPLMKPPYGRITAIDLNTGNHLWMVPNSDTPDWIKNHPALQGVKIPPTGNPEHVGMIVTKTLLIAGEGAGLFATPAGAGGNKLRAYDKKTGEVISEFELPANQSGVPMTYMVRGRQYIVVAVGAVGHPAELVALTAD